MRPKFIWFLLPAVLAIAVDQLTKWLVRPWPVHASDGLTIVPGLLELVHEENPGAAFSLFADLWFPLRMTLFGAFTLGAVVLVSVLWRQLPARARWSPALLGLIIGGALGNAIDRALRGSVTDFIRFYTEIEPLASALEDTLGMSDWPTFNVADVALAVGVVGYMGLELWTARRPAVADSDSAG